MKITGQNQIRPTVNKNIKKKENQKSIPKETFTRSGKENEGKVVNYLKGIGTSTWGGMKNAGLIGGFLTSNIPTFALDKLGINEGPIFMTTALASAVPGAVIGGTVGAVVGLGAGIIGKPITPFNLSELT
ncbi:MAG: hypothetical protein ACLFQV_01550 [Vulcanimicrobiota bacterium]